MERPGTAMPAFKDTYSAAQIGDLAQYVLSLMKSGASGTAQKRSAASNSSEADGAAIYAEKCASCHEDPGRSLQSQHPENHVA